MTYHILTGQDVTSLRVTRVHTLEKRLCSIELEAEEIGGFTAEMQREVADVERRIAVHMTVLDPPRDKHDDEGPGGPGDSGDGGRGPERDELGARRHAVEHADGPTPDDRDVDGHSPLPPALGHEEDDLPDAAHDAHDHTVTAHRDADVLDPLGHVERDADVLALRPDAAGHVGHASEVTGVDDGEPGRHAEPEYTRGGGYFDRVGTYDA